MTIDDPVTDISDPFNLQIGDRFVGYGTQEAAGFGLKGFKALVLQPQGVPGSLFTLRDGQLFTTDDLVVSRSPIEDRSLLPKKLYAATSTPSDYDTIYWQVTNSVNGEQLTFSRSPGCT